MSARPPEQDWFAKADDNLEAARRLLGPPKALTWVACFHAQQCAERYLKGYLVAQSLKFNFVHDLYYLMQECSKRQPAFLKLEECVEILGRYGAEICYPMEQFADPDEDEAWEAVKLAQSVAALVKQNLQL